MKIGKVPENVLKRAVFKQIHHRRTGAGRGFCAFYGSAHWGRQADGGLCRTYYGERSGNGRSGADRYFEQHYFAAGDGGTGPQTYYERIGAGMR